MTDANGINRRESDGYNALMYAALVNHDPYDQFAWVQDWRFALADAAFLYWGVALPYYRPAPGLSEETAYEESYAFGEVYSSLVARTANWEDVQRVYMVLSRYREWLALAGKDY